LYETEVQKLGAARVNPRMQVLELEEEGKLNLTVRLKKRALQGAYDLALKKKKVRAAAPIQQHVTARWPFQTAPFLDVIELPSLFCIAYDLALGMKRVCVLRLFSCMLLAAGLCKRHAGPIDACL
jgi:hypothetical protein